MLALIAGSGDLPGTLFETLEDKPLVAALEGFEPAGLAVDQTFRIETLGGLIALLKERGVTEVCFAGSIRRPPLDPGRLDAETQPLVPRLMAALQQGDDAALRVVLSFFEEAGIAIRAAHEIEPGLLPPSGCLTERQVSRDVGEETIRARQFIKALADADIGQACVVARGQCLALEASFGTDWMLKSLAARPDNGGGLLYKAPKPGQDRRIDLPTIGPETVALAHAAKLDGIVIEAGGVMVLDLEATVAAANASGLFLWVEKVECP